MKKKIREAAEKEEQNLHWWSKRRMDFCFGTIGTGISKPHLTDAPWLIVVFAERYGKNTDGSRRKIITFLKV